MVDLLELAKELEIMTARLIWCRNFYISQHARQKALLLRKKTLVRSSIKEILESSYKVKYCLIIKRLLENPCTNIGFSSNAR